MREGRFTALQPPDTESDGKHGQNGQHARNAAMQAAARSSAFFGFPLTLIHILAGW